MARTQGFEAGQEEHESDDIMNGNLSKLTSFHVTGIKPALEADDARERSFRPALFAGYGDLTKLRYDFPLVLVEREAGGRFAQSLSDIVDGILSEMAPQGAAGERLRKHVLKLEEELRGLVSQNASGSLLKLWDTAERNLLARTEDSARELLRDSLECARNALQVDGEVLDCDEATPVRFVTRAWNVVQAAKIHAVKKRIEHLVLKLSDILRADYMKTEEARSADIFRASVGTAYDEAFDFAAMSGILAKERADGLLPDSRRQRVQAVLRILQAQRFHAPLHDFEQTVVREPLYDFVFDSCAAALEAFRSRLPEVVEVIKAMSIAELEIQNLYRDSMHDPFFDRFDEGALGPDDLALFPSYLICLRDERIDPAEAGRIFELLNSDLPAKILVQTDDLLRNLSLSAGQTSSVGGLELGTMALGLNKAFVLQATNASLYKQREQIVNGLRRGGPALFSVFSGAMKRVAGVTPYLLAGAAEESRAFPVFAYDPAAGPDWASRFRIDDNPQVDADWPAHRLTYEDRDFEGTSEEVVFTFVDFALCDGRHGADRVPVARGDWHDDMIPVGEHLDLADGHAPDKIPYVLMVDENDLIQRVVVDDKLIRAARRCGTMWHSLQELGGINNSHARQLLDQERETWEQQKGEELAKAAGRAEPAGEALPAAAAPSPASPAEAAVEVEAAEPPSDEPYVETPRCTTCNECTELNNKLFAYNENMQAYIADPDAGPYRQIVEAAESCQVSIIHPGKPRNPNEPNLDELLERAAPFN
jgi:hypothetical protein